jgi:cyclopropane-fatty-acyl-phospholipid synthase
MEMPGTLQAVSYRDRQLARDCVELLADVLKDHHPRTFAIRLWDGTCLGPDPGEQSRFSLFLKHPGAVRILFQSADELAMAEGYLYDDFDIEGDIEEIYSLGSYLSSRPIALRERLGYWGRLRYFPTRRNPRSGRPPAMLSGTVHSKERDRDAIAFHYGHPRSFWECLLGESLVYSCGYYASPTEDLSSAQTHKLEYVCRKLRLRPGEQVLDIGCGWGSFLLHAARHHAVTVVGITVNEEQKRIADDRIRSAGLADRCRVELRDYRDLQSAAYDKVISLEMFEHVGEPLLGGYFASAYRALRPGGVFLNQGIAIRPTETTQVGEFAHRYVFPDGQLISLGAAVTIAESQGFELCDVESLREHYVLTLRHWLERLEAFHRDIAEIMDEVTYRVFRIYFSNAAYRYRTGRYDLYQILLSKGMADKRRGLPLQRADWYS